MDATYREVRELVPELGELTPEGGSDFLASKGLTEATAATELFDTDTTVEFNFEKVQLYSYYFFLFGLDNNTAILLFPRIKEFYSSAFGRGREEEEQDGDRFTKSIYWIAYDLEAVATINTTNEASVVSWGFQQPGSNTEY